MLLDLQDVGGRAVPLGASIYVLNMLTNNSAVHTTHDSPARQRLLCIVTRIFAQTVANGVGIPTRKDKHTHASQTSQINGLIDTQSMTRNANPPRPAPFLLPFPFFYPFASPEQITLTGSRERRVKK